MAVAFTRLSGWMWGGKRQEPKTSNGSSLNSLSDAGLLELDTVKFPLFNGGQISSSSRRVKQKWKSREERKIDRELDVVVLPLDGGCVSGSESDDSDWSIGWLEPHGSEFQSDDDPDDSFAVLVPCYGRGRVHKEENFKHNFLDTIGNVPDMYAAAFSCFSLLCREQEVHGTMAFLSPEQLTSMNAHACA
ncbi:hypothetical protein RHGRI_016565 [Rhododendron griersonianum]|uniref:Uncharacterized protein n=1 Tax=Rhododendron griersonianum TaxID=479676 RepID=A0AAV6JUJ4_9ERIC|nr:hypothetical protein RHGRI_016565 [Rhododendron griersonianum]